MICQVRRQIIEIGREKKGIFLIDRSSWHDCMIANRACTRIHFTSVDHLRIQITSRRRPN